MTYTALLGACGVDDPDEVDEWVAALGRARVASDRRIQRRDAPYRGLQPFGRSDAAAFFGREDITARVLARVAELHGERREVPALVAVVGASGSGKSSLLHAGVAPAFEARFGTTVTTTTPGTSRGRTADSGLLIVDQFEEIFTAFDADGRSRWLDALIRPGSGPAVIVFGLRADFYVAALAEPSLVTALQDEQILVPPLTRDELRAAIVQPAERVGVAADPALVDAILDDLAPTGSRGRAHDPGALPLMSHALLSAWTRATGNRLTVDDYRSAGGIAGAVQQTADEVYAALDPAAQSLSRRIFTRLVNVDDEIALTRRRVARDEILELAEPDEVERIVGLFVDRRLLTQDVDSVQISHEALLTAWPRLHEWIDDNRTEARIHRQVTEAANLWADNDEDETLLLAGGRLVTADEWRANPAHEDELNQRERAFLDRSDQVELSQRTAERRANRRLRQLLAAVVVLLVAASVLAVVALRASGRADRSRVAAANARDQALARELAAQSDLLAESAPNLAAQLAVEAVRIDDDARTRAALIDRTGGPVPTRLATPGLQPLQAVAVVPHSSLIAAAGVNGSVEFWRRDGTVPTALPAVRPSGPSSTLFALAVTPDGHTLFSAGAARTIAVWDVASGTPRQVATLSGFTSTVYALAVNAAGTQLAAASADKTVRIWPIVGSRASGDGTQIKVATTAYSLSFSPDGKRLAVGLDGGNVALVDTAAAKQIPSGPLAFGSGAINAVAFGPDGNTIAAGSSNHLAYLATLRGNVFHGAPLQLGPAQTKVNALAFRAEGSRLLVGSSDQQVREYDTSTGFLATAVGNPQPVTSIVAFGDSIATASTDGYVSLRTEDGSALTGPKAAVFNVAYSADGTKLVVGPGSLDGTVQLWRAGGARPVLVSAMQSPELANDVGALDGSASISPDGTLVASGTGHSSVYLWDVADAAHPVQLGRLPGKVGPGLVENTAFSPDGKTVVAAGDDSTVRLWDISDPKSPGQPVVLTDAHNYTYAPSFSHDGRYLAVASADQHAYVWRLDGSGRPPLVARLGGFNNYVYSTAFSPTSDLLAVGDTDVRLYRVQTQNAKSTVRRVGPILEGPRAAAYGLAFSPDGKTVATASQDDDAYLWSVPDGAPVAVLTAGSGMFGITFSPDGSTLLGAAADKTVHRWTMDPTLAARSICSRVGAAITSSEWDRYLPGLDYDPPCG